MNKSSKTYKLVLSAVLGAIILVMYLIPQVGFIRFGPILATTLHIPVILAAIYGGPSVGIVVGLFFGILSVTQAPVDPTFSFAWATGKFTNYLLVVINAILPRVLIGYVTAIVYKYSKKIPKKTSIIILITLALAMLGYTIYRLIITINSGNGFSEYYMYIILMIAIVGLSIWISLSMKNNSISAVLASGAGSLTNTILFLTLAYVFFKDLFAAALKITKTEVLNILVSVGTVNGTLELIVSIVLVCAIVGVLRPKN